MRSEKLSEQGRLNQASYSGALVFIPEPLKWNKRIVRVLHQSMSSALNKPERSQLGHVRFVQGL